MNTLILMQVFLILHLTGLTLMAGTEIADFITFKTFSKRFYKDGEIASGLLDLIAKFSVILGIGGGLLILSGIGLFTITNGAFLHQLWFKIKLILILVLILNGFLNGGRQGAKLKKSINERSVNFNEDMKLAMQNLKLFYITQMGIFLVIIILAVFKFN